MKHRNFDPVDIDDLRSLVDVLGGRIELFARGDGCSTFVVLDHLGNRFDCRNAQALRLIHGDESTDRSIVGFEVGIGDAVDFLGSYRSDAIALQEPQTPIAKSRRGAEGLHHRCCIIDGVLVTSLGANLSTIDFLGGEGRRVHLFDDIQQDLLGLFEFAFGRLG